MSAFVSSTEALRRLNHPSNLMVRHSIAGSGNHNNHDNAGRTPGSKNYSKEIKALIGILAKADGTSKVSEELNIAPSLVSHYKNGKTQVKGGIKPDPELIAATKKKEEELHLEELVRDRIIKLVESVTDDKISNSKLTEASKAASNLSNILDRMRPKDVSPTLNQKFVFYGTPSKTEEEYEVIEAQVVNR